MSKIPTILSAEHLPDRLVVGPSELVTSHRTVTGNATYARGTVLSDTGEAVTMCIKGAVPVAILATDCDCSGGDVPATAIVIGGTLNARALILGDGLSADDVAEPLSKVGIHLVTVVSPMGNIL